MSGPPWLSRWAHVRISAVTFATTCLGAWLWSCDDNWWTRVAALAVGVFVVGFGLAIENSIRRAYRDGVAHGRIGLMGARTTMASYSCTPNTEKP